MDVIAYVCKHVFDNQRPILLIILHSDGWQCLCGELHQEAEIPKIVGIGELAAIDPSINEVLDLHFDWQAERASVGDQWIRRPCTTN